MNTLIKVIVAVSLGLGIGWGAGTLQNYLATKDTDSASSLGDDSIRDSASNSEPSLLSTSAGRSIDNASKASKHSASTLDQERPQQPLDAMASFESAGEVIAYLEGLQLESRHHIYQERGLRNQLKQDPSLALDLLNEYVGVNTPVVQGAIATLLETVNMRQQPFLEPLIMENILAGEDASSWLKLLGEWGLQAKSSIGYLLTNYDIGSDPEDFSNAIRAVSKSSWAQSPHLTPEERRGVISAINPGFSSASPEIRAAAINSLRTLPTAQSAAQLVAGIRDSSKLVRDEANQFIFESGAPNDAIYASMARLVQDVSVDLRARSEIASTLANSNAVPQQYRVLGRKTYIELRPLVAEESPDEDE